ncbi:hypothetical protein [Verrucosispora sp. WMMC514]|uniref:hypothetical protein n=1 Tax=Verrucosispora sp. WMMC514 TaxID=3015156 RepID=UPI00248C23BA|nr:hypothetical protein [Verrucosispora sp. WMMC514]WBB94136.1 hypothetical protein O7597_14905 [Verrucosispora sp. WMMC514]
MTTADLAAISARLAGVESTKITAIARNMFESRPEIPNRKTGGTRRGKYADDPFPTPDGYAGTMPWWHVHREAEVEEWFKRHPRRQKGDGIGGPVTRAEAQARLAARQVEQVQKKVAADLPVQLVVDRAGSDVVVKADGREYRFDAGLMAAALGFRRTYGGRKAKVVAALVRERGLSRDDALLVARVARWLAHAGVEV